MANFINTVDVIGDAALVERLITRNITEYADDTITIIGESAFHGCQKLVQINCPEVTSIGSYAFSGATASSDYKPCPITEVHFPKATAVGRNAFYGCESLMSISFPMLKNVDTEVFNGCKALQELTPTMLPVVETLGEGVFRSCRALVTVKLPTLRTIASMTFIDCSALKTADFSSLTSIGTSAFLRCGRLTALILRGQTRCSVQNNSLNNCYHLTGTTNSNYNPDGLKDGYIYVPAALVDSYKTASNWSTYATQFRALEDYTVDGTITGELDESKI